MKTKNDTNFISKFIKKTITISFTVSAAMLLISFNNAEKLNANLKQSSLTTIGFESVELKGQLILNYPGIPVIKIQDISDYKVLELIKNGKVHFKITKYEGGVYLIEKEVDRLRSSYKIVLKDMNDQVYQGKLDVVQNQEPDIKYYAMYNGAFRRTLKVFDCMLFEGNYPAERLKYIINNEVKGTENFHLNASEIKGIEINYMGKKVKDWKIEIDTNQESITEFEFVPEQESFAKNEHEERELELLKEKIHNNNLSVKAALSKLPEKRKDWETTEYFSQERPGKDIEFHRNGAKIIIKSNKVKFMDDGYFRTGPFLVKLEQDKLIINTNKDMDKLIFSSDSLEKINQEIHLNGNSELALNDEFIFKANEIVILKY